MGDVRTSVLVAVRESKAFFKYGRRYGRGSTRLSWPIFLEYSRNILGNWGLPPQFLRLFLECSGNIGQLGLGDPLPYVLPYLKKAFERAGLKPVKGLIRSLSAFLKGLM